MNLKKIFTITIVCFSLYFCSNTDKESIEKEEVDTKTEKKDIANLKTGWSISNKDMDSKYTDDFFNIILHVGKDSTVTFLFDYNDAFLNAHNPIEDIYAIETYSQVHYPYAGKNEMEMDIKDADGIIHSMPFHALLHLVFFPDGAEYYPDGRRARYYNKKMLDILSKEGVITIMIQSKYLRGYEFKMNIAGFNKAFKQLQTD